MAITVRIDEFSAPGDIDGTLSKSEQVRFLTLGFDIAFAEPPEPVVIITPRNRINFIKKTNRLHTINKIKRVFLA